MARRQPARKQRTRSASAAALRALSLVVVLLLGGSSLAQIAHFLLVQHAFCAEHGELLEVANERAGVKLRGAPESDGDSFQAADLAEDHDHCQLLARNQREQLLVPAANLAIVQPAVSAPLAVQGRGSRVSVEVAPLVVAPKTSPPAAAA